MFKKRYEFKFNDSYNKAYDYDGFIYDIVAFILHSDLIVESVSVVEDVDMDMKVYSGSYSYSEFKERDELYNVADALIFFLNQAGTSIRIDSNKKLVILTTKDPILEIQDLITLG